MKILLLTDIPPTQQLTAGLVLDQLCRFLPQDALCCFALVHPFLDIQVSPELSAMPVSMRHKPNEGWYQVRPGWRRAVIPWIGEWWTERRVLPWLIEDAVDFGRRHRVDTVWAVLQGQTLIRMALPVARALGAHLITQVWDPFSWWATANCLDRLSTQRIQKAFDAAIANSAGCAAPSERMAELFRNTFGVNAVPVIASHDPGFARGPFTDGNADDVVTIGMAGQFYAAEAWTSLITALELEGWRIVGRPVRIVAIGPDAPPGTPHTQIEYLGWKQQPEAVDLLSRCTVLYCPYPFDAARRDGYRLSFPSKIPLYFAAGRPVAFHGPADSSPQEYLRNLDVGVCCNSLEPTAIYGALERLISDDETYARTARNAHAAFLRDFTLDTMRAAFGKVLGVPLSACSIERAGRVTGS